MDSLELASLATLATSFAATAVWRWSQNRILRDNLDHHQRTNERLTSLLGATNTGTWEWEIASGALVVNDRWLQILGGFPIDPLRPTIHDWRERIHPDDLQTAHHALRRCLRRQSELLRCDVRMRHADGHFAWVDLRARVIEWGADARAIRMIGTLADITERKLAEQREHTRSKVLQMLATDAPLEVVLDEIARQVSAADPRMLCAIRLHDAKGHIPMASIAPHLPPFFIRTLDGFESFELQHGEESVATTATIASDLATHPSWTPYVDLARRAGLGACWSLPITSSRGESLGTFSVFLRTPAAPSHAQMQLLEDDTRLTGLIIERASSYTQQQLAASVFSHAKEGISITDASGTIVDVNDTFCTITGYSRDEILGRNPRFLQSGRQTAEFYAEMWQQLTQLSHWSGEIWNRRKNGELYAQLTTISAVRSPSGECMHYVALSTDITSIKQYQSQLETIAHYDALTHLPNRVLLADRLRQAVAKSDRHGTELAVAYLDLDGFKAVNDQHGHNVGDELLVAVSRRMKAVLRDSDTIARIGGDEFVVVLDDIGTREDCDVVLQRLLGAANQTVGIAGHRLHVSASIGVTHYPSDHSDTDMLLRHADQAMYAAKQSGKNRVHTFDVAQDVQVQSQQEQITLLRDALASEQFVLYYQPKVNLRTGSLVGAEALIRWNHPTKGLLAPGAFLPVLENHPLAVEVDQWVLNAALAQSSQWRRSGLALPLSINVSAQQVLQDSFVHTLARALQSHADVPPQDLELEILETSALQDLPRAAHVLHACKDLGVTFAIDDFGTGYSSLARLKHLPVNTLKIDQSFIKDLVTQPADHALVEGVIGMSSAFRCRVIAEGVETLAHGELLMRLGCDLAQGYGIARPMPADDMLNWACQWNADEVRSFASARAHKPHLFAVG